MKYSIQIWASNGQPVAALQIGTGPRESLAVLGTASGPPEAFYLYRGQDNATIAILRDTAGNVTIQYWEEACARTVTPRYHSVTVPSKQPGVVFADSIESDFNGDWTGAFNSSPFSISIQGIGSQTTAVADFGLGTEQLVVLGFAEGPPRTLNLFRPQDMASIGIFVDGNGQTTLEYWEDGCARSSPLTAN